MFIERRSNTRLAPAGRQVYMKSEVDAKEGSVESNLSDRNS